MSPHPANPNIDPVRYNPLTFRLLEILPGVCIWSALLLPFLLSVYFPLQVTIFIILFDVYWFQKAFIFAYDLFKGYALMRQTLNTNWSKKLTELKDSTFAKDSDYLNPDEVYHAVIYTTYKEEFAILDRSINSLLEADYDKQKMIVVLATEERDHDNAQQIAAKLKEKYTSSFKLFLVTEHPASIAGEVKGKGANATWAAKSLTEEVRNLGLDLAQVVVSTADADTRFMTQYFSRLSFLYITTPDRIHRSYQPIASFLNNIWEAPMVSRVMGFQTTFWQLTESVRDYRLLTFSTHAMSLKTLTDINYWCTSIVNEDSRQFFRAYFHYQGNFKAIPLFMPVYMDAVHVNNTLGTWKNLYLQQQRWAYGVEHFPYITLEALRERRLPLLDRLMLIWRAFNGTFFWATNAFFLSVVGWLPLILNNNFKDQVVASNFPTVTSFLLSLTWFGILVGNVISLQLLPPRPEGRKPRELLYMVLMWVLVPICTIIFGALPGIDSPTRLMLGRYLGFRVTEKKAVGNPVLNT